MIPRELPRPEDVEGILELPFIVMYWPMLIGAALFFLALARGHTWIAVPVAVIAAAVQVMRLGLVS